MGCMGEKHGCKMNGRRGEGLLCPLPVLQCCRESLVNDGLIFMVWVFLGWEGRNMEGYGMGE